MANEDILHLQVNIYKMYKQYLKHFQGTLEADSSHKTHTNTHTHTFVCLHIKSQFILYVNL